MKLRIFFLIFCALALHFNSFAQTVPKEEDITIRSDVSLNFPIIKSKDNEGKEFDRLTFSITGTLRFLDNASRFADERIGLGLTYRVNKNVSFTSEYLYRVSEPVRNRNDFESRVRFAAIFENKWKKFSISDRNMVEYRMRNSRPNSFRYRNRFRFNYPILKEKKEVVTPFVSVEPFYDFSINKFSHNELFAGISKKFNKNLTAEFYYLLVNDRSNPKILNGFGVNFKFRID